MLAQRIRKLLEQHPHWGADTLAEHLHTTPKTIRVTASREGIRLMNRRGLEEYVIRLQERASGQT